MTMARPVVVAAFPLLLLLVAAAHATGATGPGETAALRAEPYQNDDPSRGNASLPSDVPSRLAVRGSPEFVPSSITTEDEKIPDDDADGADDGDEDEDDGMPEGEEGEEPGENEEQLEDDVEEAGGEVAEDDEYEDELKALAESHEAMSKDETRKSNVTATNGALLDGQWQRQPVRSFDSRETSAESTSDENVATNEAVVDERDGSEKDKKVAELLKYKKERALSERTENRTKTKRVPTVKKELSTQREIIAGGNETQMPKILLASDKANNDLSEDFELVQRRDVEQNELMEPAPIAVDSYDLDPPETATFDDRYAETTATNRTLSPTRKLDKRQESALRRMLAGFTDQQRQRQKLEELGVQESALAESLLKLLVKLAEDPSRWERVHQLLRDVESDLEYTKSELDARKRNFEMEILRNTISTTPTPSAEGGKKGRKKPNASKKRRKKPRRQRLSTTSPTSASSSARFESATTTTTPSSSTRTTETSWLATTPVQWRLVAERLFGPPWPRDLHETSPGSVAKVRYSIATPPRTLPSSVHGNDENRPAKLTNRPTDLGADKQTPMAPENRQFAGQPRRVHFGKVNTHQSGHSAGHREPSAAYERETDHMRDYDPPEPAYQASRYDQFSPDSREYSRGRIPGDFRRSFGLQENGYAHNREYRPPNREYAMTKSWPDLSFKYGRPWKPDERPLSTIKWTWRQPQNDMKPWLQRSNPWEIDRDYGQLNGAMDGGIGSGASWNRQEQQQALPPRSWEIESSNTWPIEKSRNVASPWSQSGSAKNYDRESPNGSAEKAKNRAALNKPATGQENGAMPKISMKTWNSLTSDPATWPFKLPGAKPWPKDKNGKSYNPNAELVRKLGLDKQSRTLSTLNEATKDDEFAQMDAPKYDQSEKIDHFKNSQTSAQNVEMKKPSQNWSMMLSGDKDWSKTRNPENLPQNDDVSAWRGKYESPMRRPWNDKNTLPALLPKIQSVGAWVMPADQSTWKSYEMKHGEGLNENFTGRRWSGSRSSPVERPWPLKDNGAGPWSQETDGKNPWASKINNADAWSSKANPGESWTSELIEEEPWNPKVSNPSSWSANVNKGNLWPTKGSVDAPWNAKVNNGGAWSEKNRNASPWSGKMNEDRGWTKPNGDTIAWQQKVNEEWTEGIGKGTVPSGNWPSKWKQFAYHRVTAMPMTKPGTTADASPKSRNAFVAVSAVSSPKETGNGWRKNDIEETVVLSRNENGRSEDPDHPSSQLHAVLEPPIYAWKKDGSANQNGSAYRTNDTDPLENQLESLREKGYESYKDGKNEIAEIQSTSSVSLRTTETTAPTNTSSVNAPQSAETSKKSSERFESHRHGISTK